MHRDIYPRCNSKFIFYTTLTPASHLLFCFHPVLHTFSRNYLEFTQCFHPWKGIYFFYFHNLPIWSHFSAFFMCFIPFLLFYSHFFRFYGSYSTRYSVKVSHLWCYSLDIDLWFRYFPKPFYMFITPHQYSPPIVWTLDTFSWTPYLKSLPFL